MHREHKPPPNLLGNCLMDILWVQNEILLLKRVPHFIRSNTPCVHRKKAMGKDQAGAEREGVEGCGCLQAPPSSHACPGPEQPLGNTSHSNTPGFKETTYCRSAQKWDRSVSGSFSVLWHCAAQRIRAQPAAISE